MQPPNLCIHFQRGFCSYGSNCRFLHQHVGALARGGGRFGGGDRFFTQTQGGGRGGGASGGQYSYYQESYFQVATSSWAAAPRPPPAREWSAPGSDGDPAHHERSFNFRFMSWNVLAAELAHSHASELYPQSHPHCLEWRRRLAGVVSHVAEQRPDVLCLQEVDDWPGVHSELGALGYDGVHVQRTGGRGDGCATLWLRDRLRLAGATKPKSGSGSGSGSNGGVHKIRMADHDLKDNVALLVHLRPRRDGGGGGGGGGGGAAGVSERGGVAARTAARDDCSVDNSSSGASSGSSIDIGSIEGGAAAGVGSQLGRRPKRNRQSCEDDGGGGGGGSKEAAAEAATAAIAALRPYPRASGSGAAAPPATLPAGGGGAGGSGSSRLPKKLARSGFWVANTHVLFNTKRGDIKLGQLRVILGELAARASAAAAPAAEAVAGEAAGAAAAAAVAAVPVIFAGDFNAAPGSGLYRFLRHGALRLAVEDRRELSGQVEGYGYSQLQRDTQTGRPPRLSRWGPEPQLRNHPATLAAAAAGAATAAAAAATAAAAAMAGSSNGMEEWRRTRQAQHNPQQQQQQQFQPIARTYSVRWEEEELNHAMGRVAVGNAVAEIRDAKVAAAAGPGASGQSDGAAGGLSGGSGNGGGFRSSQTSYGFNGAAGQSGRGAQWREQAAAAAAQWCAVTDAAVVRHPLQLRSAYAALDEQQREPLFTTLHARYVGTVDFVWYTPGGGGGGGGGGGSGDGDSGGGGSSAVGAGGGGGSTRRGGGNSGGNDGGFSLTPVRVLHPPDPLSYPYGMPCADWPSDHVSLVVDFRLSCEAAEA